MSGLASTGVTERAHGGTLRNLVRIAAPVQHFGPQDGAFARKQGTDIPFQPYKLDDSFLRTDPGRPHVPPGYYLAEVASVTPTPKDYDKTSGFTVSFRILEGPVNAPGAGVGREIPRYASMGGKENS